MRRFKVLAGLGVGRPCRRVPARADPRPRPPRRHDPKPTAAQLVALHERERPPWCSRSSPRRLEIDAKQGRRVDRPGGDALLPEAAQLPAAGRRLLGQPAVDIGSNNDEFWFWISQAKDQDGVARVHYCSYHGHGGRQGADAVPVPAGHDRVGPRPGRVRPDKGSYTVKDDAEDDQPDRADGFRPGAAGAEGDGLQPDARGAGQAAGAGLPAAGRQGQRDLPGVGPGRADDPDRSRRAGGAAAAGAAGLATRRRSS